MNKVKKQHYLPQFYLRNFADESGQICVVDTALDAPYIKSRVADVAQGRYYYDFLGDGEKQSLEKLFGIFENQLAPKFEVIIDKAQKGEALSTIDREAILTFIKIQFIRSDWMRDRIPSEFIEEHFKPEYVDRADKLIHAYVISKGLFTEMLDYISEYEMKVYTYDDSLELFTSSFPMFFNHVGSIDSLLAKLVSLRFESNMSLDSNLFFPLSSRHAVYIYKTLRPLGFEEDSWISSFITSGLAWSRQRIYFRGSANGLQLYPILKPAIKLNVRDS